MSLCEELVEDQDVALGPLVPGLEVVVVGRQLYLVGADVLGGLGERAAQPRPGVGEHELVLVLLEAEHARLVAEVDELELPAAGGQHHREARDGEVEAEVVGERPALGDLLGGQLEELGQLAGGLSPVEVDRAVTWSSTGAVTDDGVPAPEPMDLALVGYF